MSHPEDSISLVQSTFGDLMQLHKLNNPLAAQNENGVPLELREGEVVQCLENNGKGVLIARADGSQVLVPMGSARRVEIRWV